VAPQGPDPRPGDDPGDATGRPEVPGGPDRHPVYKARLVDAGVTTFAALAGTTPDRIAEIAKVGEETAADWAKQASDLTG
jgi:hypothetical protein